MGCRYPWKRPYRTMTQADRAAAWARRREADAHLVMIFECEGHLHIGHRTEDEPPEKHREAPPPLTHTPVIPEQVLARVGYPTG